MRVLIALDATPQCTEIVREAASRPWPVGSRFLLLHVLDPFAYSRMPISLERAKEASLAQIESAADGLRKAGWKTKTDVVLGRARQVIPKSAVAWKADLVLVGSHGGGALLRVLLGSTARSVLRHAPCSVEIVRPLPERGSRNRLPKMKILIATDGSEFSAAAIRSVASRPWPKGSMFKVISIPEPFMPLDEFRHLELKEVEKLNAAALKDAKRYAETGAEILAKAGLEAGAGTLLPRDSDSREIAKVAERWRANLVILGSHGRRGFDRWTIGSVSEHVALHAHCSVEIVRRPSGRPLKDSWRRPWRRES
jgi:nucleotide-binding universal stress UspA family protein